MPRNAKPIQGGGVPLPAAATDTNKTRSVKIGMLTMHESIRLAAKRRPIVANCRTDASVPDWTSSSFSALQVAQYGKPWIVTTQSPQKGPLHRAQGRTPSDTST